MMTHKCKAHHPNSLKDAPSQYREAMGGIAFERRVDLRGADEDGGDDDDHAEEGEGGGAGELVDGAVEGEGVGDGCCAEDDDELAVGEEGEGGGEGEKADDVRDGVPCTFGEQEDGVGEETERHTDDDTERAHS